MQELTQERQANNQQAEQQYENALAQKAAQQAELQEIISKDPWRRINGATNFIGGAGWFEFQGERVEVRDGGIFFKGDYGNILTVHPSAIIDFTSPIQRYLYGDKNFFVEHFPYAGGVFYGMMAYDLGNCIYTNSSGQVITIRKFDYGTPCTKIWSPEELAAIKERVEAPKKAAQAKIVKSNQDLADKGDPYGLLRMGELYRDGDGVPKDLTKARDYFSKAVAAGSPSAAGELSQLNQVLTNSPATH